MSQHGSGGVSATDKGAPVRSPSYPVMGLQEAVTAVSKIEARYRGAVVDRVDAVKLLGYTGLSGPANQVLAALALFGLVERAGKGEIRVTERARMILHPNSEKEKAAELHQAAATPQLYRELLERFPGVPVPPEEGVRTFLNRQGFNSTAVKPAARAFLQTMEWLKALGANDSYRHDAPMPGESAPGPQREAPMTYVSNPQPTEPRHEPASAQLPLNEPSLSIRGGTVHLEARLDYDGLAELEDQIKALKMILKPKHRKIGRVEETSADFVDSLKGLD